MQRQETIVQPWGRVLVLSQGIHRAISLRSSAELSPHRMEDVNYLMRHFILEEVTVPHHHLTPGNLWIEGVSALHAP